MQRPHSRNRIASAKKQESDRQLEEVKEARRSRSQSRPAAKPEKFFLKIAPPEKPKEPEMPKTAEMYGKTVADVIYDSQPKHKDGPFEGLPNHEDFWEKTENTRPLSSQDLAQKVKDLEELLKHTPTMADLLQKDFTK